MAHSVIVVGGGPAGALLAYLLASRGVPTTLIERQSDFAREFRGEGLMPGGQRMFQEAGLWDAFEALPQTRFTGVELFFKRRRFAALEGAGQDDLLPRWVSQPAMLEMLVDKASAFDQFRFRRGVRVIAPVMRDGRAVGIELTGPDGDETLEADYVFACDGRFSALRKAAGLDQPRNPESFDIVWCKLPLPAFFQRQPTGPRAYIGNGHLGLFIPAYDGLLQIGWVIQKGTYRNMRANGIEHWLDEIGRHVSADLAEHLRAHAKDAVHPFLLDVVCDCYDEWSVPGMTLIGDAAHPMSPVGAQGINVALRDAVVAANHFVPPLLSGARPQDLDAASTAFHAERIAEVEPIQALQRRGPKIIMSGSALTGLLVWMVRGLLALGIMGWLVTKFDLGPKAFLHGVTEVKLTV